MMVSKKILLAAISCALIGGGVAFAVQPTDEVIELLSGTANSPSKSRIDLVMGDTAVEDLIAIANDTSADSDPGLKIRAYSALRHFGNTADSAVAQAALEAALDQYKDTGTGTELLYLRASMLALAEVGLELSVPNLISLLAHPSRDIRAACAQALGITGSSAAIQPLRDRALVEPELQVQLAIADALFVLDSD
jgi:HEAT repeat protein